MCFSCVYVSTVFFTDCQALNKAADRFDVPNCLTEKDQHLAHKQRSEISL